MDLSLISQIVQGGVALVLAIGIVVVWKTWRAERTEHRGIIDDLADKLQEASKDRHTEAIQLIRAYERAMADFNTNFQNLANQVQQTLNILINTRGGGGSP